jgi:hypothetical protein
LKAWFGRVSETDDRKAAIEGDPVDVALELAITIEKPGKVALVNMANDKRPGGDWEAGMYGSQPSGGTLC